MFIAHSKGISVDSGALLGLLKQALGLALGLQAEAEALVVGNVALEALRFSSLRAAGRRVRHRVNRRRDPSDEFLVLLYRLKVLVELLLVEVRFLVEESQRNALVLNRNPLGFLLAMGAVKGPVSDFEARRGPAQLVGDQGLAETVLAELGIVGGRSDVRKEDWIFPVRYLHQFVEEHLVVALDDGLLVGRFLPMDFQVARPFLGAHLHQRQQFRAVGQRVELLRLLARGDLLQLVLVHLVGAAKSLN